MIALRGVGSAVVVKPWLSGSKEVGLRGFDHKCKRIHLTKIVADEGSGPNQMRKGVYKPINRRVWVDITGPIRWRKRR